MVIYKHENAWTEYKFAYNCLLLEIMPKCIDFLIFSYPSLQLIGALNNILKIVFLTDFHFYAEHLQIM